MTQAPIQGQLQLSELSLFDEEPEEAIRPARPAKKAGLGFQPIALDPKQTEAAELAAAVCDHKDSGRVEVLLEAHEHVFPKGQRPVVRVNAVAGSGKSRTLLGTIGRMGRQDNLLLSTFNNKATKELEERAAEAYPTLTGGAEINGFTAKTINALGHALITSHFEFVSKGEDQKTKVPLGEEVEINGLYFSNNFRKYQEIIASLVESVDELEAILPRDKDGSADKGILYRLFKLTTANLMKHPSANQLLELVEEHGLRFQKDEGGEWVHILKSAITQIQKKGARMMTTPYRYRSIQNKKKAGIKIYRGAFSFDDQVWMPFYLGLTTDKRFSRALVDEYQDLSIAQFDVLLRCLEPDAPVVLYGDIRQTIYGFNGAGPRVRAWLDQHLPAIEVELNDCYRCPEVILAIARHFNGKIRRAALAGPDAPGSRISAISKAEFSKTGTLQPGDVVMARTRAAAVMAAMRYAISVGIGDNGKFDGCKIIIRKDFGLKGRLNHTTKEIRKFWLDQTKSDTFLFRRDFQEALTLFTERQQHYLRNVDAMRPEAAERVVEGWEELSMISSFYEVAHDRAFGKSMEKFQDFMANMFIHQAEDARAELSGGIEFRTVHAMKGAEADRVFVVDLGTTYSWTTDAQREELRNIRYVCLTRARRELFLVTGFVPSMESAVKLLDCPVPRPED